MFGHILNKLHCYEKLTELLYWKWLWINLIHAALDCFLDVLVFSMTRYGHYPGLLVSGDSAVGLADECGGLIAIHEWHAAVHQDQTEAVRVLVVD